MECVQHIVCRSCYSQLGKEHDVLMCGGCKLWQHRKCVPDVLPSFYAQFYVSVLQEQKPKHWLCNYCSRHAIREPSYLGIKLEKEGTSMVSCANLPISMDISDSENELHMSFENNRIEREGQAQYPASSLSSLEDQATPEVEIIISPRPVIFDHSPLPITYTLHKKPDGQKVVKDCHGNEFKQTTIINPDHAIYRCVHDGCGVTVRAREDLQIFLSGGEFSQKQHIHDSSDSSDGVPQSTKSIPDRPANRNQARKGNREPESTKPIPDRPASMNQARQGNGEPESDKSIPDTPASRNQARKGNGEPGDASITYTLTDGLASGNQARLTDSKGFCYQIKYKLGARVFWTCTEKVGRCSATVIQQNQDKFTRGAGIHTHKPGKSESTSDNEELSVSSSTLVYQAKTAATTQQNVKTAATVETTQQNVKTAATLKPTKQNINSAATVRPTQQNVKSAATVKTTQQNVNSAATIRPTQQNVKSAATVKTTQQNVNSAVTVRPTQQNVKSAATVKTTQQNVNSAATVRPTQQNVNSAATVKTTQQNVNSAATVRPSQQNVKSAATVKTTQHNVNSAATQNSSTTPVSEETPLTTTDVLYQEISTCTMYAKRPQSTLTSSDGYIYKTKNLWALDDLTEWKCTHKGPNGKCQGQVDFDHFTWTFRYDYSDPFVWTEDQKNARIIKPHNHQPDMEAAVMIKMKAMIHRQVYGYGYHNDSAKRIIDLAKDSMCDWEKQHVSTCDYVKCLKRFVWRQQKQYRDEPRCFLDRYMIHR